MWMGDGRGPESQAECSSVAVLSGSPSAGTGTGLTDQAVGSCSDQWTRQLIST